MYPMYVDESGDTGTASSPTERFIPTGMVFHEVRWQPLFDDIVHFRWQVRLKIQKWCLDWIAGKSDIRIVTVYIKKKAELVSGWCGVPQVTCRSEPNFVKS
jgi:hypothetical protein